MFAGARKLASAVWAMLFPPAGTCRMCGDDAPGAKICAECQEWLATW
jgi:hypothetical protein